MSKKRIRKPTPPDRDNTIRLAAYYKWEQAGRPEGDGVEFWLQAEKDYAAQNGQVQMLHDALEEESLLAASSA